MLGLSLASGGASQPAIVTVTSEIISIAHTAETASPASGELWNSGGGESNFTELGAAIAGGAIIPTLTGTWQSLQTPGRLVAWKLKTNVIASDISTAGAGKHIDVRINQGYTVEAGNFTNGSRTSVGEGRVNTKGAAVTDGGSFDVDVPGTDTTYTIESVALNTAVGGPGLALGTNYTEVTSMNGSSIAGPAYWAYNFAIADDYPSKTYKFQIELTVEI